MTDFAPTATPRYKTKYNVLGQNHSATIRFPRDAASWQADAAGLMTDLFTALAPKLFNSFAVIGADYAEQDSDVFLPSASIPVATSPAGGGGDSSYAPQYCSFVGRSATGGRAVIFIYGWAISPHGADNTANDWRVLATEDSDVADAVAILNGGSSVFLAANDGGIVTWYPYVNVGQNAGKQRKARRG